jgi:hypothetical protein
MADLTSFLVQLAQDPALANRFKNDPTATMTAEGLSTSDQDTVLSGDPSKIKASVDATQFIGFHPIIFCILVSPGS